MNKTLRYLLSATMIALAMILTTSCDGGDPEEILPTPTPTPDPDIEQVITFTTSVSTLEFPSEGGTRQFTLHTSVPTPYIRVCSKWITVENDGEIQIVTVDTNTTGNDREGFIRFHYLDADKPEAEVKVIQKGQHTEMTADFKLKPNTRGITEDNAIKIKNVDTNKQQIQWSKDIAKEDVPVVGEKIILGIIPGILNSGLLAKVDKVVELDDYYAVDYTPVEIGDCFDKLDIKNLSLDMSSALFIDSEAGFIDLTRSAMAHDFDRKLPINVSFDLKKWFNDKVTLSAGLAGSLEVWADIDFDGINLKSAKLDYKTNVDLSLNGSVTLLEKEGKYSHINLGTYTIAGNVYLVKELPVAVFIHIPVDFVHKYNAKFSFDIGATYSINEEVCHYYEGYEETETVEDNYGSGLSSFTIGPKVEGSYQAGFAIGPVVSLYHAIGLGGTKTFQLKTTATVKSELNVPEVFDLMDKTWLMQNTNLAIDYVTSTAGKFWTTLGSLDTDEMVSYAGNLLNKQLDNIFEVTSPLRSYNLIPTVSPDYTAERNKEMVTLTLTLNGQYFLLSDMRVRYEAIGDFEKGKEPKEVIGQFELNKMQLAELQQGRIPSLDIHAYANLDPQYKWKATVEIDFAGSMLGEEYSWMPLMHIKELDFGMLDPEDEEAVRMILRDILESKDGKWEGCNWTTDGLPIDQYKFVSVYEDKDMPYVSIYIPDGWKLKNKLVINDHTAGVSKLQRWELYSQSYDETHYSDVEIYDSHCSVASIGNNVDRFVCTSPMMDEKYLLPNNVEEAVIVDSKVKKIEANKTNLPKLRILDVRKCKELTSIKIEGEFENALRDMVAIKNADCPNLSKIQLKNVNIKGNELNDMVWPSQVNMTNCIGGDIYLTESNASKLNNLEMEYGGNSVLSIDGCKNLTDLRVYKGVKTLNLNKCNSLKTVNCSGCHELNTFTYNNISALRNLNLRGTGIISKVPQLFDDMKKRDDCTLAYDTLYRYWDDWGVTRWEKRDHGYYYEGEPEQGYHGPYAAEGWKNDVNYKFVYDGLGPLWANEPFTCTRTYNDGVYTREVYCTANGKSVTTTITTLPVPSTHYQPGDVISIDVSIDFSDLDESNFGTIYYSDFAGIFICTETQDLNIDNPDGINLKELKEPFHNDNGTYYWPAGPDALNHRNFTLTHKVPQRADTLRDDFFIIIVYDSRQWVGWHYTWGR